MHASDKGSSPDTSLPASKAVVISSPPHQPIMLITVDGRQGPQNTDYSEADSTYGRVKLPPGLHTIVVEYRTERSYSVSSIEITFTGEAGHIYNVKGWPPKMVDVTTDQPVQQQSRIMDVRH